MGWPGSAWPSPKHLRPSYCSLQCEHVALLRYTFKQSERKDLWIESNATGIDGGWVSSKIFKKGSTSSKRRPRALAVSSTNFCKCLARTLEDKTASRIRVCREEISSQKEVLLELRAVAVTKWSLTDHLPWSWHGKDSAHSATSKLKTGNWTHFQVIFRMRMSIYFEGSSLHFYSLVFR